MGTTSKRDYAAEYRRRIERLTAEGFSRSQARGHQKTKTIQGRRGPEVIKLEKSVKVERVRAKVQAAREKSYGAAPQRRRGESARQYDERLAEAREDFEESSDYDPEYESDYDFESFEDFLERMLEEGLTEHEAYELWFGY